MRNGVYLIGAGPGDRKLITVKGLEVLKQCHAVVYDQLVNPLLLSETKPTCERIYAGKKAGKHTLKQEEINELLLDLSGKHKIVVRLKGGDPYVFGRGSEEAEFLINKQVFVEVIPGISSAIGGLASANIPVTARNIATSFHVITGHLSKDSEPIDFKALAKLQGTLVILMGIGNLTNIVTELTKAGMGRDKPAAIIYKASTPEQGIYVGNLGTIVDIAYKNKIKPPGLIVVGDVVKFASSLQQESQSKMNGVKIVVTRSSNRISKFSDKLEELGASVIPMPTIKFEQINRDLLIAHLEEIKQYDGIIFSSSVAIDYFFQTLADLGKDSRYLAGLDIVVSGGETAKNLAKYGIKADSIPQVYSKEGLLTLFSEDKAKNFKYLLPQSLSSDNSWLPKLQKYVNPVIVDCYKTITDRDSYWDLDQVTSASYITFTSSSTVKGFIDLINIKGLSLLDIIKGKKIVSIGPATKKTLEENKIKVDLIPPTSTIQAMVDSIYKDYIKR